MRKKIFILIVTLVVLPSFTFSQSLTDLAKTGMELELYTEPQFPSSFSGIEAVVESYTYDLSRSAVSWSVNGKTMLSGIGRTKFPFRTEEAGKKISLTVKITTPNGKTDSKTLNLVPGEVDLVWEADGYVPPFYKGKSLPSSEGTIRVIAIPNMVTAAGVKRKAEDLVYKWWVDNKLQQDSSGYGKNSLLFSPSIMDGEPEVLVEVTSLDGTLTSQKSIFVPISEPEIHFYEERPLEGTRYENVLDFGATLNLNEGIVRAEPFNFSVSDLLAGMVSLVWSINSENVFTDPANPAILILRKAPGASGEANIDFEARNRRRLMQGANESMIIEYGKTR